MALCQVITLWGYEEDTVRLSPDFLSRGYWSLGGLSIRCPLLDLYEVVFFFLVGRA